MTIVAHTFCTNGHDLAVVGRYEFRRPNGEVDRPCKQCHRDRSRAAMARKRAEMRGSVVFPQSPAELARFFAKVAKSDCWVWTGAKQNKGYGTITVRGVPVLAHRASYLIAHGFIPDGMELDHLCRNRACVKPDHLEPVTHRENMRRSPLVCPPRPDDRSGSVAESRLSSGSHLPILAR